MTGMFVTNSDENAGGYASSWARTPPASQYHKLSAKSFPNVLDIIIDHIPSGRGSGKVVENNTGNKLALQIF